jgi:hypothetical protein
MKTGDKTAIDNNVQNRQHSHGVRNRRSDLGRQGRRLWWIVAALLGVTAGA